MFALEELDARVGAPSSPGHQGTKTQWTPQVCRPVLGAMCRYYASLMAGLLVEANWRLFGKCYELGLLGTSSKMLVLPNWLLWVAFPTQDTMLDLTGGCFQPPQFISGEEPVIPQDPRLL